MVIVEGPDGAGKTTLVNRLLEEFPSRLHLGERGTKDRTKLYTVTVPDTFRALQWGVNLERPTTFLWDRLFYSEFIYAPLGMPPREPMFNMYQRTHISRVIEAIHAPVIVCLPPLETVLDNMAEEREQMEGVRERIEEIYTGYQSMLEDDWFPESTILYDYTNFDADDQMAAILQEVQDYIHFREVASA